MENSILFARIVNRYFERQQFFFGGATSEVLTAVLRENLSVWENLYRIKCLRMASEKFVLTSESN